MLHIYNNLTKKKEPFVPIVPGRVRMYVCGMTVYDYCHLGHARVMVVFDMAVRYLRARGLEVTYIRNITDIDDKIIKRARENNEDIAALSARFIRAMDEDAAALGVEKPSAEPRATAYMLQIRGMIETLLKRSYAYRTKSGDVYYRVRKFPHYGALSGKAVDDLRAGARVEIGEEKDDPLDFALWKAAKPGEPEWASPWGAGRPGWHIECSAMSTSCLGDHFDIHGGGMDLKFPHHENEIAQSEAATGEKFVNTWMHVGFVRVNREKMSKSLGNFFTVREILARFRPEVVRYLILASHYRSPLDYSDESLHAAKSALDGFYIALRGLQPDMAAAGGEHEARFHAAMEDDFNTPRAFAELAELAHAINRAKSAGATAEADRLGGVLRRLGGVLGLLQHDPETHLKGIAEAKAAAAGGTEAPAAGAAALTPERIETLIAQRNAARKAREFAAADRIRAELQRAGVIIEDGPGGTTWRRE
ncbi:MAG: cysteine--tRNA ligase [Candidatus Muproteobacteria bacterium RIFCSPHIGHO2_02_FULL_65_16]|uniref:Cysteine--tRNA ligase n=1 Tax=Candidatus Muproteobacteria bacterium RIFCSPHIGHO2_02_FULL_65_16 TaxID=1817766 RepID=A0A1F6U1U1_9PROT|nr:MAG: cysteine--tRNA ligase [Candidatus Muproteobacteria bacterium RIFCSPHIGHO2_02_FULL_65_16]